MRGRHRRTRVLHRHLPAPQGLEGGGQARGEGGGGGGRGQGVRGEPALLEPLRDQVGGRVVDGAEERVAGGHGELGLQQHGVHGRVTSGRGVGEKLAQVLLIQARAEQVGVGVGGRGLGRAD